ncbi:hypothetical protein CGLAU_00685 [Corynebacterium glaucum]|uniref:Uncharacterized protein n=1 Tax=Corynebacterium glaucum TaxID=187491 RepID=A0A1Q2HTH7_9CORY|nr:hypothetical protein CGLAU_00685 [Corynebacterium glaucum]
MIPDHGLGAVRSVSAIDLDRVIVAYLLESAGSKVIDLPATLLPRANSAGFVIESDNVVLGAVSTDDAREYPELYQIINTGLVPQVTVRATRLDAVNSELSVRLPRPGLLLPENQPPSEPWVFLEPGRPTDIVYDEDAPEALEMGRKHVLTTVGFDDAGDVVVRLDGNDVAHLDPATSAALEPTLRALERRGLTAVARGYHAPVGGQPQLTITVGPVDVDYVDEFPAISPLPGLDALTRPGFLADPSVTSSFSPIKPVAEPVEVPSEHQYEADEEAAAAAFAAETEETAHTDVRNPRTNLIIGAVILVAALVLIVAGAVVLSQQVQTEDDDSVTVLNTTSEPANTAPPSTAPPTAAPAEPASPPLGTAPPSAPQSAPPAAPLGTAPQSAPPSAVPYAPNAPNVPNAPASAPAGAAEVPVGR